MQGSKAVTIVSINVGMPSAASHGSREVMTGIWKWPVDGALRLSRNGLPGDGQADLVNHGGPDKAVCVYTADHAAYWSERWGRAVEAGAFGENFTISGGRETDVCIGDIFRAGEAVVQVSQARLPCFKLGIRQGKPSLPEEVQETGYTGFYFRVLEEGDVRAGDPLLLLTRHPSGMTVRDGAAIMLTRRSDLGAARNLHAVDALASSWREMLEERIARLEQTQAEGGQPQ